MKLKRNTDSKMSWKNISLKIFGFKEEPILKLSFSRQVSV
jgi:hypothetical protein